MLGYVGGNPVNRIDPDGLRPTKNPKGPDGKTRKPRGCSSVCVTDFIGGGMLAASAGLGFRV